jgi:enoyl-CoA hydratase/carnithine racemase
MPVSLPVPEFQHLIYGQDGKVARITLNRPEVVNALSVALSDDFCRAVEYLRDNDDVRVVVINGAGVFSARAPHDQGDESPRRASSGPERR